MNRVSILLTLIVASLMLVAGGALAAEPDAYPTFYTAGYPQPSPTATSAPATGAPAAATSSRDLSRAPDSAARDNATRPLAPAFPLPSDAEVVPFSDTRGTTAFYTSRSIEDAMAFYREALSVDGAVEREDLTLVDNDKAAWFSMVFEDWKPGQGMSVVVQGVLIEPGKYVVSLRLEDVE